MAERSEPLIHGPEQAALGRRLQEEEGNLRLALIWALDEVSGLAGKEIGLRLCAALAYFWGVRGYSRQALTWLAEALATPELGPPDRRTAALVKAGGLAWILDDYPRARRLANEAFARSRQLGDDQGLAYSHYVLGLIELRQGNYEQAAANAAGALRFIPTVEDRWMVPLRRQLLGHIALSQGDGERAQQNYQESLGVAREIGDTRTVALSLYFLGCEALGRGDLAGASHLFLQAQPLLGTIGERRHLGDTYAKLAAVALRQDDRGRAEALYRQALRLFRQVDHRRGIVECLAGFGCVAVEAAEHDRAVRMFGATAMLEEQIALRPSPVERDGRGRLLARARSALGDGRFVAAWEDGRAMTIEQAIAYALDERDDSPA